MEQMIIFVYDTGFCQTEADDPQKAVLYFHPNWVSDQQRLALCGQLMGAAHFCSSMFSSPRVLTLQSGKFVLRKFGQYIMSVGSDQTLPEWILYERFNTLQFLIQFYHRDFDTILSSVDSDHELFSKKLSQILDMYIPILQFFVSSFGNVPTIKCPKINSSVFLEAYQLLEACLNLEGVLGGAILHNSRIIATQLDSEITKIFALTDPFRVKTCAEQITTPFHLPVGVQILKVFLKNQLYETLCSGMNMKSATCNNVTKKHSEDFGKTDPKRDITRIFTVHEEEDWNTNLDASKKHSDVTSSSRESMRHKNRRSSKSKPEGSSLKERSKNFKTNHNISICSTPTVEKTLIHEDLVSICSSAKLDQKQATTQATNFIPDLVQDAIKSKKRSRMLPTKYSSNRLHRMSMDDLMIDLTHKAFPVPMRYYSFGLPKLDKEAEQSLKDDRNKRKLYRTRFYKTIADPMNPVFRFDGLPVSKSLYNHCLDEHYKDYIAANITIDSREEFIKSKNLESQLGQMNLEKGIKTMENDLNERLSEPRNKENVANEVPRKTELVMKRDKEINNANQKLFRRSLTLPLKPLSFDSADNTSQPPAVKNKVLHAITPSTPLMTKLSLLALEEQQNDQTAAAPSESVKKKKSTTKIAPVKIREKTEKDNKETVTCSLFVCGQQNMTILLLLDESCEQNPDLILSLWETSTNNLDTIENLRNKSMDHLSNSSSGSSTYSFLSMDPQWGTIQRLGPWGNEELKIVGSLHQNLIQSQNITEVIVRNEDAVVYGYRCGGTETFYQQGGCSSVGLPTPADLMGVVTLKAKRRLERDHGFLLL